MTTNWKVEQSGRFTVTSSQHEMLDAAVESVEQFIAAATTDANKRLELLACVLLCEGEPVELPNGKRLELIDMGEQF